MTLLYAWLASISSGLSPIIIKASSKDLVKNPWAFNILWVLIGIPFIAVFALLRGAGMPADWLPIFLLALSLTGFYIFYTVSLYRIDVSTMSPLFSLRTVFSVILGVWLLNEYLSPGDIVLISIIILLSPLAAYDDKMRYRAFFQKSIFLAVLAMFFLAFEGYFANRSAEVNGYSTTLLWQDILVLIFLLPTIKYASIGRGYFTKKKLLPFVLLGISGFIYTATSIAAYAQNLALSAVIISLPLSMIFAVLLSIKYKDLLERNSVKVYAVRFSAAGVMVASAIFLSLK